MNGFENILDTNEINFRIAVPERQHFLYDLAGSLKGTGHFVENKKHISSHIRRRDIQPDPLVIECILAHASRWLCSDGPCLSSPGSRNDIAPGHYGFCERILEAPRAGNCGFRTNR